MNINYPPNSTLLKYMVPLQYRQFFAEWLLALPCNYGRAQLASMLVESTAQHSKPKDDGPEPQLANFCKKCGHIAWLVHLKWGLCLDCQENLMEPKKEQHDEA